MSSIKEHEEDDYFYAEHSHEEDPAELAHRKIVRKKLEDRLESKRLREELEEEWDHEFNWDEDK